MDWNYENHVQCHKSFWSLIVTGTDVALSLYEPLDLAVK